MMIGEIIDSELEVVIMAKQEMIKPWYKSKTIWVNVFGIFAAVVAGINGELVVSGTLSVATFVNILLRVVTTSKIY